MLNVKFILAAFILALTTSAIAQISNQDFNPWDNLNCLTLECGQDVFPNHQLAYSIDYFNLDYGAENFTGFRDFHHKTRQEIRECTAVCYSHLNQGLDGCNSIAQRSNALLNRGEILNKDAVAICEKAVRDTMYECISQCTK